MSVITKDVVAGLVRHVLTYVGGVLVTNGIMTSDDVNLIAGGLAAVVGVAWSIFAKKTA